MFWEHIRTENGLAFSVASSGPKIDAPPRNSFFFNWHNRGDSVGTDVVAIAEWLQGSSERASKKYLSAGRRLVARNVNRLPTAVHPSIEWFGTVETAGPGVSRFSRDQMRAYHTALRRLAWVL